MRASTIDDVVATLDGIITTSVADNARHGYFAALYNRVTERVRTGIHKGEFQDGARMMRLDVTFANRYLDAYDAYASGGPISRPWARTFDATQDGGLLVIQYLLLAMTTHIMFDLGIAVTDVAPGPSLPAIRQDYLHINDLLAEEIGTVENQLIRIAGAWRPPIGGILGHLKHDTHGVERSAAALLIDAARRYAWDMACTLVDAPTPADRDAVIAAYEQKTTDLLDLALLSSPGPDDDGTIAATIKILAQGEL